MEMYETAHHACTFPAVDRLLDPHDGHSLPPHFSQYSVLQSLHLYTGNQLLLSAFFASRLQWGQLSKLLM